MASTPPGRKSPSSSFIPFLHSTASSSSTTTPPPSSSSPPPGPHKRARLGGPGANPSPSKDPDCKDGPGMDALNTGDSGFNDLPSQGSQDDTSDAEDDQRSKRRRHDSDSDSDCYEGSSLWRLVVQVLGEPPRRRKLRHVNTIGDVVRLLRLSRRVLILTGAGVSVSSGIPDFRGKGGLYSRAAALFPGLPDPQAVFDVSFFRADPRPFFVVAKELFPGKFTPSACHRFVRLLEQDGRLLRNYTQNVDTLEKMAGVSRVIECHGSLATASCQRCRFKVDADEIRGAVLAGRIPLCPKCHPECGMQGMDPDDFVPAYSLAIPGIDPRFHMLAGSQRIGSLSGQSANPSCSNQTQPPILGVLKPDIVFFGEGLPEEFHNLLARDRDDCDLLIVIGSSLKVRPVALIPNSIPSDVPQVLINREPLRHLTFDVELLGDCDQIIGELAARLGAGWEDLGTETMKQITRLPHLPPADDNVTIPNTSTDQESAGPSAEQAPTPPPPYPPTPPPQNPPTSEDDLEGLRACWQPRRTELIASRLPDKSYLFLRPNRYVFPGAELYFNPDEDFPSGESTASSTSSSSPSSPFSSDTSIDSDRDVDSAMGAEADMPGQS